MKVKNISITPMLDKSKGLFLVSNNQHKGYLRVYKNEYGDVNAYWEAYQEPIVDSLISALDLKPIWSNLGLEIVSRKESWFLKNLKLWK
jgi:hypothetical protein